MSSIVIAGDTSGTVTLDAPAVAGTTVLTLPATSGTVVTTATSSGISGSAITTGTVGVSVGGTGANTLTANNVILGNGTSAVQFVAPGSSGNVLTSNGTTWTSAAASGGQLQTQLFTAPGTWTKPASCTQVRVTVIGGGGSGGLIASGSAHGGAGGVAIATNVPVSGPVSVTVGDGGAARSGGAQSGAPGGTSSFGPAVSATGGGGGIVPTTAGANGSGTVSSGTSLKTGNTFDWAATAANSGSISTRQAIGGYISGLMSRTPGVASAAYSTTSAYVAGGNGAVSSGPASSGGGTGGAVLVEFVG